MIRWNFGQEVLVLPAGALDAAGAGETELRVLLWLASDATLAEKPRQLASLAGCTPKKAEAALGFWRAAGVFAEDGSVPAMAKVTEKQAEKTESPRVLARAQELPNYTSEELSSLMEKRKKLRELINEAQNVFGRVFNVMEINVIVGMSDCLGMENESILLLLSYCRRREVKTLRTAEKLALMLADEGILTVPEMQARLQRMEEVHTVEGKIRRMFGISGRTLIPKENKMIEAWLEYGYGEDVITRAYEVTVNATGNASLSYANSIMERWHAEGLKTLAEIDADIEKNRAEPAKKSRSGNGKKGGEKANVGELGNSFDTEDFFESALNRSFADKK